MGATIGTGAGVHGFTGHPSGVALVGSAVGTANIIVGRNTNTGTNVFRVNGAGAVFAAAYNTGGADFAEAIDAVAGVEAYEPGDVMVIA